MTLAPGAIRFAADGDRFVVRAGEQLACHGSDGTEVAWQAAVAGAVDHVVVGREVWVTAVQPARLVRLELGTGAEAGMVATPGAARMIASAWAPGVALGYGDAPWQAQYDGGELQVEALAPADFVVPVAGGRVIAIRGGTVELRRPGGVTWRTELDPGPVRVIDGALLLEGRLVALATARPDVDGVRVIVLGARDGMIHHALTVAGASQLTFAPRRPWLLARIGARRLVLIDLRFGRVLRQRDEDEDVHDVATDGAFQHLVLSVGAPARLVITRGDTFLAATTADEPAPTEPAEATPVVVTAEEPAAAPQPASDPGPMPATGVSRAGCGLLLGLGPPAELARCTDDHAAADLPARLRWIGALVERAISQAWDSGRLTRQEDGTLPYEAEVDGVLDLAAGRAQARLEQAERHGRHYEALLAELDGQRGAAHTPLQLLAVDAGLSPLAVEILLVAAAPLLWGELARLFGILSNDVARPLCDELLICQILAPRTTRAAIAHELDPDQPLRRLGLVVLADGAPRPFGAVRVDPVVINLMRGGPPVVPRTIRLRPASRSLADLLIGRDVLEAPVAALARPATSPARVAIRGRTGSGRRTLAAALAAGAGRALGIVDAAGVGLAPDERAAMVASALLRCRMLGWIPCVDGLDDIAADDRPTRERLRQVFRDHPGPVMLRLPVGAELPLDPGYQLIDLPVLPERLRAVAWREALVRHGIAGDDATELAARFRVGPGVVERVAEDVAAALRPEAADTGVVVTVTAATAAPVIDRVVRQHLEARFGGAATPVTRLAGWADVILPEEILDSLLELVARVRHRKLVFEGWGYERRISSARGITALFQGGPGTGKTMVAGVIARELGLELYRVDVSRMVSKWIGETEKNLAAVFDAAEDGQAILLFDEADSLFGKRTEVKSSVDRYANLEVNYLLQRLDTFEGIALLTTNFGTAIDPAFRRRLTTRMTFPFPDEDMRERLWRAHIPVEVPRAGELDLADLAQRYRLSGGYIRNAALRAAFLAAEEGTPLSHAHLERAVRLEFREVGKLADTGSLE